MTELGRTLARDGVQTLVVRIANIVFALALSIVTARLLGPVQRGVYALPTIDAAFTISVYSGLVTATSYFMLNRRAGAGVLRPAMITAAIFVVGGLVPVFALAALGHDLWAAIPAAIALPFNAMTNVAVGYAYGTKRVRYGNLVQLATTVVTLAAMVAGLFFVARTAGVAIAAWLIGMAVVA
ncbi:MAG: hypothetical protein JOZ38_12685, partial [Candidatus Eremiobacteraeota bacterium]|nr:hypothetical protein [Candidatus Eremiobacteraeota bacterium]